MYGFRRSAVAAARATCVTAMFGLVSLQWVQLATAWAPNQVRLQGAACGGRLMGRGRVVGWEGVGRRCARQVALQWVQLETAAAPNQQPGGLVGRGGGPGRGGWGGVGWGVGGGGGRGGGEEGIF
jgi:hypothetical protein